MTDLDDRYRLGVRLGSGGVADVYRARDLVLDRDVAVKVLRDTVDDAERGRFTGEARMLARLSHAGLVTVLDVGIWGTQPYVVMELVEGSTLEAVLREGPLPVERVADVGGQLASAIAYAHGQDVVHRDVKPANVLLGPGGDVKLADFGIARLLGDTMRHTRTGTTIGTPAYLSPEQARGATVGPPTDVYSLGLVLLEALTGERAFTGTPIESAMARLQRPPAIPDDLGADWRELLAAMTASDPGDRPTAAEVATRIRATREPAATRVLGVAPAPVTGADAGPAARTPTGLGAALGNPLRVVAAVAAATLLLVALVLAVVVLGDDDATDDDPDQPAATSATPTTSEPGTRDTATGTEGQQEGTTAPVDQQDADGKAKDKDDKPDKGKGKNKDKGKGKGKGKDKG